MGSSIADRRPPEGIEVEEVVRLELQAVPMHEGNRCFLVDVEVFADRLVVCCSEIPDEGNDNNGPSMPSSTE